MQLDRALIFPILLPLGTTAPIYRRPRMTYGLIGINVLFYLAGLFFRDRMIDLFALWPDGPKQQVYQYLSYAFLHEGSGFGLVHMGVNMFFFWIFASGLENKIGPWRMLGLYVLTGIAGGIAHQWYQAVPNMPLVGASGAVYGTIGAFMMLFPFASVKCFFCLLIVVVPILVTTTHIMGLFFIFIYWGLDLLIWFVALNFGVQVDSSRISTAAHLGGIGLGAGLATTFYGFYAFTMQAVADAEEEHRLQRKLASAVKELNTPDPNRPAASPMLGVKHPVAPLSTQLHPLHEHVLLGRIDEAHEAFAQLVKTDPDACLTPGPQMDLARLLNRAGDHVLAAEALERLLRKYPHAEIKPLAQFELAHQLVALRRDPERATELLNAFLDSQPPMDLEREANLMLARLNPPPPDPEPAGESLLDDITPQSSAREETGKFLLKTDLLFGDPEDTDANAPPRFKPRTQPMPGPSRILTPEPKWSEHDVVTLDSTHLSVPTQASAHEAARPHPSQLPPSLVAHPIELDGISEPGSRGLNLGPPQPTPPRPARPEPPLPTVEAIDLGLESNEQTQSRAAQLRDTTNWGALKDKRFAVILAPRRPLELGEVVFVMSSLLNLTPEATHHAILRRRGILIADQSQTQAELIAGQLARHGQSVVVAAQTGQIACGRPLDVLTYKDEGRQARFSTADQVISCPWEQVVCLGAGLVTLAPTTPPRAAFDLILANPARHLRIWENTFTFPRVAPSSGDAQRQRFRLLAEEIAANATRAIHVRTLDLWLDDPQAPQPRNRFYHPIEYQNYLTWHLLAYLAPSRLFSA